jgi:hypothetical protein
MRRLLLSVTWSTPLAALLASGASAVVLSRAPDILETRLVGTTVQVLWAPGGDADGTLNEDVVSYKLERKIGGAAWTTVFTGDEKAVRYVDDVSSAVAWWDTHPGFKYRVTATTSDSVTTVSDTVGISPLLPMWIDEARDGKARIAWTPSQAPAGYPVHKGYVVQKKLPGGCCNWQDVSMGYLTDLSYVHAGTVTGPTTYRVKTVYEQAPPGTLQHTRNSSAKQITINAMCDGQASDPNLPPLDVVEIIDWDSDLDYDGYDVAIALEECSYHNYERLDGPGNNDGVCNAGEESDCLFGGCILRALPVTYDDVAVRITSQANCATGPTVPTQCVSVGLEAGLVIEGEGAESVFRSPLWTPPYLPGPVLEVYRQDFQFTLRNIVLDGRKFEQVAPGTSYWAGWWYGGLYVAGWGSKEILGDGLGDNDGVCDGERCVEDESGVHDGDDMCEPGEDCLEHPDDVALDGDGTCTTDRWTNTPACESEGDTDDGCIHNVEVRDIPGAHGVIIANANRWIIEDNDVHDLGCVNRGFGYDCPNFDAPDAVNNGVVTLEGFKTYGNGILVAQYTSDFQVRRNKFQRATKYGLSFAGEHPSCNGLARNHEAADNDIRDMGAVGLFAYGVAGSRIHDNTISKTTVWKAPPEQNPSPTSYGMSLGGYCTDDNEFSNNTLTDLAGIGIAWNADSWCSGSNCDNPTPVGNTLDHNTIDGTCLEKPAAPGATSPHLFGSIHFGNGAGGKVHLSENTLTDSQCRVAVSVHGEFEWISPFELRISGGSYESGPNAATQLQDGFVCGAIHQHSSDDPDADQTIVVAEDTSIVNTLLTSIPKACVGYYGKLVIRDAYPATPFDGLYSAPVNVGGSNATLIQCSDYDGHPGPEPPPPLECQ